MRLLSGSRSKRAVGQMLNRWVLRLRALGWLLRTPPRLTLSGIQREKEAGKKDRGIGHRGPPLYFSRPCFRAGWIRRMIGERDRRWREGWTTLSIVVSFFPLFPLASRSSFQSPALLSHVFLVPATISSVCLSLVSLLCLFFRRCRTQKLQPSRLVDNLSLIIS